MTRKQRRAAHVRSEAHVNGGLFRCYFQFLSINIFTLTPDSNAFSSVFPLFFFFLLGEK